jgi:two-component system, NarL family, invasion response regulator UvrY
MEEIRPGHKPVKKITLVVVDDHKLLRDMWRIIFRNNHEIEVIGESGEFNEAIELIKAKRPDIVLLDINLPPASGMDAVPLIRKLAPGTKIIGVSVHRQPAYVKKMLQLGAKGYLTKNSSSQEMLTAIKEVMNDQIYICSEIKEIISEQIFHNENSSREAETLSLREIEIIHLIKQGFSSKEIAVNLYVSVRTIEVHRRNILKKLKLKNTPSLINYINNTDLLL